MIKSYVAGGGKVNLELIIKNGLEKGIFDFKRIILIKNIRKTLIFI